MGISLVISIYLFSVLYRNSKIPNHESLVKQKKTFPKWLCSAIKIPEFKNFYLHIGKWWVLSESLKLILESKDYKYSASQSSSNLQLYKHFFCTILILILITINFTLTTRVIITGGLHDCSYCNS